MSTIESQTTVSADPAKTAHEKAQIVQDKAREAREKAKGSLDDVTSLRAIIIQTIVVSVLIVIAVVIAAMFFKEPLTELANWLVNTFGIWGVLAGIAASDIFTFPIPPDTFIFIAATSDYAALPMLTAICVTSIICGSVAYFVGPQIQRIGFVNRRIEKFRERGEALFGKWGVWAVAIGALSPLPYSITCWMAGIYKMPYGRFFLATLFRAPRMVAYYYLFVLGWLPGN